MRTGNKGLSWLMVMVLALGVAMVSWGEGSRAYGKKDKTGTTDTGGKKGKKKDKGASTPPPVDTTPSTPSTPSTPTTPATPTTPSEVDQAQKALDDLLAKYKTEFEGTQEYKDAKTAADAADAPAEVKQKLTDLCAKHDTDVAAKPDVVAARKTLEDAKTKAAAPK